MKPRKLVNEKFKLKSVPTRPDRGVDHSSERIEELQLELLRAQLALFKEKKRAIIVIEGTDTSGKGGIIRRITRHLDPRSFRVWPIGAPEASEQARHYLFRFWQRLPEPGQLTIFDRSWYGRVLVERVEGHARKEEWKRAYHEINEFERLLADDGVILIKLFLHLSKEEQYARFMERIREPTKRWKITVSDLESRRFWPEYQRAYHDMLNLTATAVAPWFVLSADDKEYARVHALRLIAKELKNHVDLRRVNLLDPQVVTAIIDQFGEDVLRDDLVQASHGQSD
ncbi:MAG TPA: polyphosphate kinase [Dongiaceae bacterium]|nr:polyphosphate kinase [Dongiaceae bacterium]